LVLSFNCTHTYIIHVHQHQPTMENLNLKQGIAGQVSCSSCPDGEGRLAADPRDPTTTVRWHECGQGGDDNMMDDVCRNQPSSRLGWATVSSDELKSLYSPSISTLSNHQQSPLPSRRRRRRPFPQWFSCIIMNDFVVIITYFYRCKLTMILVDSSIVVFRWNTGTMNIRRWRTAMQLTDIWCRTLTKKSFSLSVLNVHKTS